MGVGNDSHLVAKIDVPKAVTSKSTQSNLQRIVTKEIALLVGFLFVGLVVMPYIIYLVGESVFDSYAGAGYWHFFATLSAKVRSGDMVAWFLIFSPYMGWQCLRLAAKAWRVSGRIQQGS
jgi:hypothetical protein